ncbi:flippase [Bradyrhizobium sp. SUTN9-2]|uniref:flippase n=1 Tax=Bradyrhizobium sp. SUTN9-2 TaxID=1167456 RepID=UPI000D647B9C|nr:flippase [Bradyrhizobium sp. SUTN9-2]
MSVERASRPKSLVRNYLLNAAGASLPLVVTLFVLPIYISKIGADRYGMLSLIWVLVGYVGFLDFGLSRASANALSRLASAGPEERVPVLLSSFYLNLGLGVTGAVIIYAMGHVVLLHTQLVGAQFKSEIIEALPWIALMLPLNMLAGVGAGALESRERFLESNIFSIGNGVLGQVLPLCGALIFGPALSVLVLATFLGRAFTAFCVLLYVHYTERPISFRNCGSHVKALLGYGAWVSVTSMISPLLDTADQLIIGKLLGPSAVAHYSVPMNMATRSQILAFALAKTVFPRLSNLTDVDAKALASRATITLAYGFAMVCAPAILLSRPFLTLWLGEEFARFSAPIAPFLIFGAWINGVAFIPFTFLQSRGRPDLTAKIHIYEIAPFLASVWLFSEWFGLVGAALAWTLRVTIDFAALLAVGKIDSLIWCKLMPSTGIMVASGLATMFVGDSTSAILVALLFGVVLAGSALTWDKQFRALLLARVPVASSG